MSAAETARTDAASLTELASAAAPRLLTELPGPEARRRIERDRLVTSPSLTRAYPLVPRRASGMVVEDVDGNRFLDFTAGIAVAATGHCHPRVVEAVSRQARELLHFAGTDFYLPGYAEACEELARIAPMSGPVRTFLTNSGTEAVEAAIKLARHTTGRQYIIAFFGAFHGRSYGSLSLTASKAVQRGGFSPLLPGVLHAHYGYCLRCPLNLTYPDCDLATVRYIEDVLFARLVRPEEVAAVVVEPVLGEGGYVVPPPGWLERLRELCATHGILFVADEIQTGMGRTGRMWAVQHRGIEPDILVAGKGVASGLPLGAMVAREDLMTWGPGAHGSTFAGNPLACAAALATIELLEGGLVENAARVGAFLLDGLRDMAASRPLIRDARGLGLMVGVEFERDEVAGAVEEACFRRGLLTLRAGDRAVRLSPPLVVQMDQAEVALRIFEKACADVAGA